MLWSEFKLRASIEDNLQSLLTWLTRVHPDTPRTRAKQWILAGRVSVNGVVIRKPQEMMPDPGAKLELRDRRDTTLDCGTGWQIHPRVSLLYLDSALAVVNKGPGLISVPAPNAELSALSILADFLAGRLKARDRGVAGKSLPATYRRLQPLPVHRLDQYTSGVFCMACNPGARASLIEQLKARSMSREYVAFAEGRPAAPQGTWRDWLELSEDEMRQRIVSENRGRELGSKAQEAITHYEVIAEYQFGGGKRVVTKLRLRLESGRKHQIRIQAAHAGLPLIGDRTYHRSYRQGSVIETPIDFPRQALHAESLTLEHPEHPGLRMSWKAALPKDMSQLEAGLQSKRL
jgi:23S rRNA pseudouridine1911/1915/1917 synthase